MPIPRVRQRLSKFDAIISLKSPQKTSPGHPGLVFVSLFNHFLCLGVVGFDSVFFSLPPILVIRVPFDGFIESFFKVGEFWTPTTAQARFTTKPYALITMFPLSKISNRISGISSISKAPQVKNHIAQSHFPSKISLMNRFGNQNECLVILRPSGKTSVSDNFPLPKNSPGDNS